MSSGVARKDGACSHVQVSDDVTFLPERWFHDDAQRAVLKVAQRGPASPSGARKNHGRIAICLRTKERAVLVRPGGNRRKVPLFGEFREGLAPIVPDGGAVFAGIHQSR
jgi:hypothetical protein